MGSLFETAGHDLRLVQMEGLAFIVTVQGLAKGEVAAEVQVCKVTRKNHLKEKGGPHQINDQGYELALNASMMSKKARAKKKVKKGHNVVYGVILLSEVREKKKKKRKRKNK